jgi:hypothetical protein
VVAAAAPQAVGVPSVLDHELVGPAEGEQAFGKAIGAEHQLAVAGDRAAAHHHVGMRDPAAEGKAAVEQVAALYRLELAVAGGELPGGDHVGQGQKARRRGGRKELGYETAVGADLDTPADRGIGVGEDLDHLEMLRQTHLRAALGARAAHAEEAGGAQLGHKVGREPAQRLDLLRARGDRRSHRPCVGENTLGRK